MKTFSTALIVLFLISASLADNAAPANQANIRKDSLSVRRDAPPQPEPQPFIGIIMEAVTTEDAQKAGAPKDCIAIRITGINKDSAGEKAGLKIGDLIFGVEQDGKRALFIPQEANSTPQGLFVAHIADKKPGDKLTVCVARDGKEVVVPIVLGERPVFRMEAAEHPEFAASGGKASLLEKFLADNDLMKNYIATAHMLYAASNMIQGATYIVEGKPDFFRLREVTYLLRNPEQTAPLSERIADSVEAAFNAKNRNLAEVVKAAAKWLDEPVGGYMVRGLNGNKGDVERIVEHIRYCGEMRDEAFAALSPEEKEALRNLAGVDDSNDAADAHLAALRAAAKVDFKKFFAACAAFCEMTDQLDALKKCAEAFKAEDVKGAAGVSGRVLYYAETPIGRVVIGGEGDNIYTEDFAVIIDLGGDDVYLNNAGGTFGETYFALCVDFAGDDVYRGAGALRQGAGFLGAGVLVDLAGDDTYRAGYFSQGFGLMGVGILADMAGDDTYRAKNHAQGAAWFGIGVLAEGDGLDSYHADNFAQGLGQCKGFGAVIETGGNDSYYLGGMNEDFRAPGRSYTSMGQGFGFGSRPYQTPYGTSGGIGLLADAEGHDRYVGDYFCQGSSYWYALGILRDRKGNDHYFCGRYSQGAGIHLSLGALIDCAGDDSYIAYFGVSQGCGHDWAYGILEDKAGNDLYQAGWLSQGVGNDCGMGVLFDHKGDDRYVGNGDVQGHGTFNQARKEGSVGIFMDLDGEDEYISPNGSADGKVFKKDTQIGLFFDVDPATAKPGDTNNDE